MTNLRRAAFLILIFGVSLQGRANAPKNIDELLNWPARPTMEQSVRLLEKFPEFSGIPIVPAQINTGEHQIDTPLWTRLLLEYGPELIATMEKTFPGATWAFIGRDSQAIGDMLEGFYIAQGQHNRVARLMVSKASFGSVDQRTLTNFVLAHGFSYEKIQRGHPYIFVDTVSQGGGQQGRMLLNSLYDYYQKRGGNPADLVEKLNMFGLAVSTYKGTPVSPSDIKKVLLKLEILFSLPGDHDYRKEFEIVAAPGRDLSNEAGYEHFTGAWTGSFGEIKEDNGTVEAIPGPIQEVAIRQNILWMQKVIWKTVKSQSFKDKVIGKARELGYEFPLQRPPASVVEVGKNDLSSLIKKELSFNDAEIEKRGRHINFAASHRFNKLSPTEWPLHNRGPSSEGRLSRSLNQIWDESLSSSKKDSASEFLEFLMGLYQKKSIGSVEVYTSLIHVLSSDLRLTTKFVNEYTQVLEAVPDVKDWVDAYFVKENDENEKSFSFKKLNILLEDKQFSLATRCADTLDAI